jgi:prepilin-type N-terminal cleavage/methylation domain-containing protein
MMEARHALRRRRSAGFSMIEVLVAVALLAVILLALFSLVSLGVQRAYSGKKMTQATIIAQAAMERANAYEAHALLGADSTMETVSQEWIRTGTADADTTPADVTASTTNVEDVNEAAERNAWRKLLKEADLPAEPAHPATLKVSMTAVPDVAPAGPRTFDNATMERIQVELTWYEWGTRKRQVRLQSLNLPDEP